MRNRIVAIISVLCFFHQMSLFAQYLPKSIAPYHIDISFDKTSNLIFPSSIKSVDRGSSAVLAQKAQGVENILQLKAGEQNFKQTNVTVITGDGHFYSFAVTYAAEPSTINLSFVGDSSEKAIIENQPLAEASFTAVSNAIKSKRHSIHNSIREEEIKISLTNIFAKNDLLWLEMEVTNQSLLPFTTAYARFFIQDTKTAKRTATQQNEVIPLYKTPVGKINEHASQTYVFAFTPFAVPHTKELLIQIGESEGNRLLTLPVNHRIMQRIKSLKAKN